MNKGLEAGFTFGKLSGLGSGLLNGFQSSFSQKNNINTVAPNDIKESKIRPLFHINGENVSLTSGAVQFSHNVIEPVAGELMPTSYTPFQQTAGTSFRPPLVRNGINGRNYMNFGDTPNRYLINPAGIPMYAQTSPSVTATGLTFMFVIKRVNNTQTWSILDCRDSTSVATPGDLLIEINPAGRITFDYRGGAAGSVTTILGTAGINLLNNWSILTIKCQLRRDGGAIPTDSGGSTLSKRYSFPSGAKIGPSSVIDIFVNGVEQQKTITSNTYTNSDYYNDNTYRMLDRDLVIGNKKSVYGTGGTFIASVVYWPCYIDKAIQQRIENYFRSYYSLPF